jgi:putative membrane protein
MLLEQFSKLTDAALAFTGIGLFVPMSQLTDYILSTLIFVGIGLVFFAIAFVIIVKVTPFSIRKELEEDQNTALAIVIGSVIIGIALIVSAAIHG